jgi:peptide deformylase
MKKDFKKKYNLVDANDAILNTSLSKFDFSNSDVDPKELATELLGHMRYFGGIGLSANQLGLPYRVFVMEGDPGFVCFNPVITASDDTEVMLDEGCLSYPGMFLQKKRPGTIRVRFQDPFGNVCVKKFSGMSARIFQHELEHMNGENFLQGVGEFAVRRAKDKQRKLLEKLRRQNKKLVRQHKNK